MAENTAKETEAPPSETVLPLTDAPLEDVTNTTKEAAGEVKNESHVVTKNPAKEPEKSEEAPQTTTSETTLKDADVIPVLPTETTPETTETAPETTKLAPEEAPDPDEDDLSDLDGTNTHSTPCPLLRSPKPNTPQTSSTSSPP